jgi:vancomycin resistance protein YoaR
MNQRLLIGSAGGLLVASGGLLGWYFLASGTPAAAAEVVDEDLVDVAPRADGTPEAGEGEVVFTLEDRSATIAWSELAQVNEAGQLTIDDDKAIAALVALRAELDRPAHDAHMDLEARALVPEQEGLGIDVYGALALLRGKLSAGAKRVTLPGIPIRPDVTAESLGNVDISHVLGRFTTKFAVAEKRRNDNLKLAASKLDGHILMPGAEFSFNDVVGARTEKEGYKIAHVITSGEMVDGLAGGTCQISSTLHGASFFAGLEIVKSLPHSRPSTYVQMGLDATVVYPVVDLELRNPYDFPVVIHYTVARGESVVEILGKQRPYDKITFERQIEQELPFDTVTREDNTVPVGSLVIEQEGFPGYKMKRFRRYYKDGKLVKTDKWSLRYRPVTEYSRMGTNPDPNLPPPVQPKSHGPRAPKQKSYKLSQ